MWDEKRAINYFNSSFSENKKTLINILVSFCSALAYAGVNADQPQLNGHTSELASAAHQGEPRPGVGIPTVLPHGRRQHSGLRGVTSEQH